MGKIYQGILGGVSKKVGSVVGSSWKGIPTLRAYQPNVSNPKTSAQVNLRTSFKKLSLMASDILATNIKDLWDRFAVKMSGYNSFVQANKGTIDGAGNVDTKHMICSRGKMEATALSTSYSSPAVTFTWATSNTGRYQAASDIAYFTLFNKALGTAACTGGIVERSVGSFVLDLELYPNIYPGGSTQIIDCYLSFERLDGSVVSSSSPVATITAT